MFEPNLLWNFIAKTKQLTLFPDAPSAPPADCVYERRTYRHSERFYHPTDSCRSCACTDGKVHCQRKPCPFASCSHPITQECCQTCEGKTYLPKNFFFFFVSWNKTPHQVWFGHNLYFFSLIMFFVLFPLQAAFMRVESELTERRGMTLQIRVRRVFVAKARSGVRGSAAHPPTVSTRSRGSAACPVMVSDLKEKSPNYWRWSTDLQITKFSTCRLHVSWWRISWWHWVRWWRRPL